MTSRVFEQNHLYVGFVERDICTPIVNLPYDLTIVLVHTWKCLSDPTILLKFNTDDPDNVNISVTPGQQARINPSGNLLMCIPNAIPEFEIHACDLQIKALKKGSMRLWVETISSMGRQVPIYKDLVFFSGITAYYDIISRTFRTVI